MFLDPGLGAIVAVIRADEADAAYEAARAAWRGGIQKLEITWTTPSAAEVVRKLVRELPKALVGAGSMLSAEDGAAALDAGAQFFVSPHLDPTLTDWFIERDLTYAPGCMTPSELVQAHGLGCELQKLFPAGVHGPSGVRAMLAPLPFLKLVVSGGVSEKTARDFLAAGAAAICVGSQVFSAARLKTRDYAAMERDAAALVALVAGP